MMVNTLTYNMARFSGIEIAVLVTLILLLNLRVLSITAKKSFLKRLQDNLLLGIIPVLLISVLIMINQLIAAITTN